MENKPPSEAPVANKGLLVTFAGTSALLALGVLYAWSVIKANIPVEWGWAEAQKTLPYSVSIVVFSIMTFVGARLLVRFGPRVIVSAGGILAGSGVIISSLSTSPWVYTAAFGVLLGSGIGFVYASASPSALKWFPASKTGLISGIVVAGFGMGSAWVAPLARSMIASLGLQTTMLYLGIGMLIAVVGFAQFIKFPPSGFVPVVNNPAKASAAVKRTDYLPREVIKSWQFYIIWIAFAFGSGAGLMVIGNLASIVTEQIGLAAVSAVAVSALALGNGAGRVIYGTLSDKIGRKTVLIIAFIFQAGLILVLSRIVTGSSLANTPAIMLMVALIGVNYGANLSVFPAITKDYYGPKNFAVNYGMVYTAWGLGGFMLSQLAGVIKDMYGVYNNAYLLAAGILLLAAAMTTLLKTPQPALETQRKMDKPATLSIGD